LVAPGTGDLNIFVKVSSYTTQIAAIVPEPGTALLSLLSIPFALRRRR
ncbi:MAG: PEP-CTERM sorting domain-containing protein, partial [Armatimonadetes bacterium]|nr:PEP-CTERM sorting domain-containing protein [Akkermansiaceae bacterium]